eukprot:3205728-Prymnesium_polylepis.1
MPRTSNEPPVPPVRSATAVQCIYTVARARGEVIHTPGITSQSPGGDGSGPVMPQVGPQVGPATRQ